MRKVTRTAPAKINLGLDVTGTRPDGYHLLETVFQAVSIADTVTVELIDTPDIALTCDVAGVPCSPKNIAWKAAQRYLDAAGLTDGVQIHIEKRIPMEAGMGGGSTDGAAVLLALQELTGNALSMDKLAEIAVSGSRCSVFPVRRNGICCRNRREIGKTAGVFYGLHGDRQGDSRRFHRTGIWCD